MNLLNVVFDTPEGTEFLTTTEWACEPPLAFPEAGCSFLRHFILLEVSSGLEKEKIRLSTRFRTFRPWVYRLMQDEKKLEGTSLDLLAPSVARGPHSRSKID